VFHDLYPFSGRWDYDEGAPRLTLFARLIGRLLPGAFRHMVLCVGKKP
jgi:hypothetical protein